MKFLINESFLKTVPKELKDIVQNKLFKFYELLNETNLYKLPNSFWIKKINYKSKEFYEFRINSGDRIIFDLVVNDFKKKLRFCYFSTHDRAIEKYKKMQLNNFSNFEILKENYTETKDEKYSLEYGEIFNNIHLIDYKIENEKFFKNLMNNKESSLYYCLYLNKEQYNCLKYESPLIINGGAGSGKTAVLFNKMLNLISENKTSKSPQIKLGYFCLNNKLKESIEHMMEEVIGQKENIKFYSITEYLLNNLEKTESNLITYKNFQSFFGNYSKKIFKGKKNDIKVEQAYSEINGIIKGMMFKQTPDNWDKDLKNGLISLDEYLSLADEYSIYDVEKREKIYKIAIAYQNYLKTNRKLDSNDLSMMMINNVSEDKKLDYIFIDEVQDLTEVQIFMINSLCKDKNNIFFAGDIHQVVTMNYFNFNRLSQLHNRNGKNIKFLVKNYRSRQKIIEASNKIKELRKKYIGSQKMEYEQLEEHISEGGKFNIEKNDFNLLEKVSLDADFIIIVSNDKEKIELLKLLKLKDNFLDMIFTVEEAKGLEFESVICYNLISSHLEEWNIILNNNAKRNQNYRYFFNLLYVGITRAKSNIIFMEEEVENNPLLKEFQEILTATQVSDSIKVSSSEEWKKRAKELEKFGKIKEAEYSRKKSLQINTEKSKIYNTKNYNDFQEALITNNHHKIKKILQNGFNPNYIFKNLNSLIALRYASQFGYIEIVKLLLEYGASTEIRSSDGGTSLLVASECGNLEIVKILLKNGANVNTFTNTKLTPLIIASQNGHIEIVKLLLKYKANLEDKDNEEDTALLSASTTGKLEIVEYLINYGASINVQNIHGYTPLLIASINGHTKVVETLLKYGIENIDAQDNTSDTALTSAIKNKFTNIIELLSSYGANFNAKDNDGYTLLELALLSDSYDIIKLLFKYGKHNLEIKNKHKGSLILKASFYGDYEIVKYLLEIGATPNEKSISGTTPLMVASLGGFSKIVNLLIEYNANINEQTQTGETALILAIEENHLEVVKILLENKINFNHQANNGVSALIIAAIKGHKDIIKILLDYNVNLNLQVETGETALMAAAQKGYLEIVKLLIERGALPNIKNNKNSTALTLAKYCNHIDIFYLLQKNGGLF
ncbi:MAG: ankyrin repeat domain-containing protein [Cetobacterium sp.]